MHMGAVLSCALTVVLTTHQRQISYSIKSKDIVPSVIKMSVIFTDLNSTVRHNNLHASQLSALFSALLMLK